MKSISTFKKISLAAIVAVIVAAIFAAVTLHTSAVPYQGDDTPALPSPQFNGYTGVPSYGDESDFMRSKVSGGAVFGGDFKDVTSDPCAAGTKYSIRAYVHNGASQFKNDNGNGPSVAKNTKLRITVPSGATNTLTSTGTITSSNAATVTDTTRIVCGNGKEVTFSYVAGSAKQWSQLSNQILPVSDSIVTTGAPIGTMKPDGNVWGCWEQRVYVVIEVEVKEVPKPSAAQCKALQTTILNQEQRRVRATVTAATQNASVLSYEINWGDGSTSAAQGAEHTYAADGTYSISARVQVRYADGRTAWVTSDDCKAQVKFKTPEPKPSTAKCESLTAKVLNQDQRRVSANVTSAVQNATVLGYEINWGDGSTSATQSAEHTYAADGTYSISARVQVRYADGTTAWVTSNDCKAQVKFKTPEEPKDKKVCELETGNIITIKEDEYDSSKHGPVDSPECQDKPVPPTPEPCVPGEDGYDVNGSGELCVELPKTGAASTVAIFAAVSAVSALGYRFFLGRRNV